MVKLARVHLPRGSRFTGAADRLLGLLLAPLGDLLHDVPDRGSGSLKPRRSKKARAARRQLQLKLARARDNAAGR